MGTAIFSFSGRPRKYGRVQAYLRRAATNRAARGVVALALIASGCGAQATTRSPPSVARRGFAWLVRGLTTSSVIVGASPPRKWTEMAPLIETSISALTT